MRIRTYERADFPALLELTLAVFASFHEDSYRPLVGETVFANRHGHWREDYRERLGRAHDPRAGKHVAVAVVDDEVAGYVGWVEQVEQRHGEIDILAVAARHRRRGVGRALAEHAIEHMRTGDLQVVSVGTGGDPFHAPARALYEDLGFTPLPTVNYTRPLR
ncbi:GNAT family N-acetyltransferase [Saccharopolyspora griseoalba]|uniref:GNAT family N-acetyltransferase n=1 Tax=Saccharopolyspora griseoalba TaxID=1431848 RepID=A0ABW2LPH3_9PSEU